MARPRLWLRVDGVTVGEHCHQLLDAADTRLAALGGRHPVEDRIAIGPAQLIEHRLSQRVGRQRRGEISGDADGCLARICGVPSAVGLGVGVPHVVAVCRSTPNFNQWIETIAGTEPSFNTDYARTAKGPWTEVELDIAGGLEFRTPSALGADLYFRWAGSSGKVTGPVSADTAACSLSSLNGYLYSDTHPAGVEHP